MNDRLSIGLEVDGTFEDDESGEVLGAVYSECSDRFTVNAGVGTGFNSDVDLAVRLALIWRFN